MQAAAHCSTAMAALPLQAGPRAAPRRAGSVLVHRRSAVHVARAGSFDESAAQVRRLLNRDRTEMNLDDLEQSFKSEEAAASAASSAPEATPSSSGAQFSGDKTPVSPFGPSSAQPAAAKSPFGGTGVSRKPFAEPRGLSPTMAPAEIKEDPWWTQITLTQIVIVLSFTTIIALMIGTFFVVVKMGGVRFNE